MDLDKTSRQTVPQRNIFTGTTVQTTCYRTSVAGAVISTSQVLCLRTFATILLRRIETW